MNNLFKTNKKETGKHKKHKFENLCRKGSQWLHNNLHNHWHLTSHHC